MAVDFSKAFDTVNLTTLLADINNSAIDHNSVRWLATYLRGRSASCHYNQRASPHVMLHAGVPQGSVLSPLLFNLYVATYPQSAELVTSYADDITAAVSDSDPLAASSRLAEHASEVTRWAEERSLQISAQKSSVTLFTSYTRQYHLHPLVNLNISPLPLDQRLRILGVTLDPTFTFGAHAADLGERGRRKLNILKALCVAKSKRPLWPPIRRLSAHY